jgi:uracil-DNA glycosylase
MATIDDLLAGFWQSVLPCQQCSTLAPWRKFPPQTRGNPRTGLMIIGEAPGRVSLEHGRPFSNPRSLTVRNALARAIAPQVIEPEAIVYFSDAVKCWPSSPSGANRSPSAAETNRCTGMHLKRELEIIRPQVIFAFGVRAATALLGYPLKIATLHGQAISHPLGCRVIPLMHPSTINIAGMHRIGMRTVNDYETALAALFRRELAELGIGVDERLSTTAQNR